MQSSYQNKKVAQNNPKDDLILVQEVLSGEKKAFGMIYNKYKAKVFGKCQNMISDHNIAHVLCEEVFSKMYEKLGEFKGKSSFSSWLYAITYNHCIDYLRNKKRMHYPQWSKENELTEIVDVQEEPIEIDVDLMHRLLEMVHPEEKALLLMKYQDGIAIKEIAKSMRITESAAKMRIKRAKARVAYLYTSGQYIITN